VAQLGSLGPEDKVNLGPYNYLSICSQFFFLMLTQAK